MFFSYTIHKLVHSSLTPCQEVASAIAKLHCYRAPGVNLGLQTELLKSYVSIPCCLWLCKQVITLAAAKAEGHSTKDCWTTGRPVQQYCELCLSWSPNVTLVWLHGWGVAWLVLEPIEGAHYSSWLCWPHTGGDFFSDLDFAGDVAIMSEMLVNLILALEILHEESSDLGLEVNWTKNKIQASSNISNVPVSILSSDWRCGFLCVSWFLCWLEWWQQWRHPKKNWAGMYPVPIWKPLSMESEYGAPANLYQLSYDCVYPSYAPV